MTRSPKTVSIRHLHTAVKTALEAARKEHRDLALQVPVASPGLSIYYRPPFICGFPPFPWVESQLAGIAQFTNTFVANLASNRQISAIAPDGKFEAALQTSGDKISSGFTPGDVSFTE
jgi:hypothetical protein